MTEQERLKILETNKPQSYFQATGKSPFEGIPQPIIPSSLSTLEGTGGLPGSAVGISGVTDWSNILKDLSAGNIASSVNIEELVAKQMATTQAELQKTRAQREAAIKEQYAPLKQIAEEEGKSAIGHLQAVSARGGGLGASNIAEGMIKEQEKRNKLVMTDLESKISAAITAGDESKRKEYMENYALVLDQQDKLFQQNIKTSENKINVINTLLGIKTKEAELTGEYEGKPTLRAKELDINTLKTLIDLPEGKSVEIGGITYTGLKKETVEPFFKGSDIVDMALKLPIGQTQEIIDPISNTEYIISGLASPEPTTATVNFTNNSTGEVRMITYDKNTGQIVGATSLGKIGQKTIFQTPASIQEYQYAVKQGYKGSFEEFSRTKNPTQTDELRQIVGENFDKSLDLLNKSKVNNFVNANLYLDLMNKFKSDYPDKPNMFTQLFPPQQYLDSNDPIAKPLFKQTFESSLLEWATNLSEEKK